MKKLGRISYHILINGTRQSSQIQASVYVKSLTANLMLPPTLCLYFYYKFYHSQCGPSTSEIHTEIEESGKFNIINSTFKKRNENKRGFETQTEQNFMIHFDFHIHFLILFKYLPMY